MPCSSLGSLVTINSILLLFYCGWVRDGRLTPFRA